MTMTKLRNKMIPARINREKGKESAVIPPGAGALLRHDVFQPVRVGGKALDRRTRSVSPASGPN